MTPPLALWLYRQILRLLPADFRATFGAEMSLVFRDHLRLKGPGLHVSHAWALFRAGVDVMVQAVRLRLSPRSGPFTSRSPHSRTRGTMQPFQDLKFALRFLRRDPSYSVVAVVILALGIGANTAIFSVVNAVLFSVPPQVVEKDELVAVYTSDSDGDLYSGNSYPDYVDFMEGAPAFEAGILYMPWTLSLTGPDGTGRLNVGEIVSANYFDVLGVRPVVGRGFAPDEGDPNRPLGRVLISHQKWQRDYGGNASVVGETVRISNQPFTIIGVAPEGFLGSMPLVQTDVWITWAGGSLIRFEFASGERGTRGAFIRARLAPGASLADAQAQLAVVGSQLFDAFPDEWSDFRDEPRHVTVMKDTWLPAVAAGPATAIAILILAGVGGILLIACANVANLTLARAIRRGREIAVRASLGAPRSRVVSQLMTESLLIGVGGGGLGIGLAYWLIQWIPAVVPTFGVQATVALRLDPTVLGFAVLTTVVTVLAVGLLPALKVSRPDLVDSLKKGSGLGKGRQRWYSTRNLLVSGQVAVSLVLLGSAGLFLRGLRDAAAADPGFRPEGAAAVSLNLAREGYEEDEIGPMYDEIVRRVQALPDVVAASLASSIPLSLASSRSTLMPAGYERQENERTEFNVFFAGPEYFGILGIDLLQGRVFNEEDVVGTPSVVIINQAMADRFWPEGGALGQTMVSGNELQVVGVVPTGKYRSINESPKPAFFLPVTASFGRGRMVIARARSGDADALVDVLRREVLEVAPGITISEAQTVSEYASATLLPSRIASRLMAVCGGLGLLLAAVGLYGVMAYVVSQRTREMGVRIALGATRSEVTSLVVWKGVRVAGVGALVGVLLTLGVGRVLTALPFGVPTFDLWSVSAVGIGTVAVAVFASWVPALRAGAVEPAVSLRSD